MKTKFKKSYYNIYLTSFIIFFFTLIQCISSQATEIDLDQKLTLNKEIIYGKLDNNFTYYIKKKRYNLIRYFHPVIIYLFLLHFIK
mgnify:CR=1 FL=1